MNFRKLKEEKGIMESDKLLSICIPTYNHLGLLKRSLSKILSACDGIEQVEVIVSDNGSNDGTWEYLSKLKENNKRLCIYRNSTNLGFNKNLFLLIKEYSVGKYVWTIGDDDFITIDIVGKIINFLKDSDDSIDLILLRYLAVTDEVLDKQCSKCVEFSPIKTSYYKAMDSIADVGNLLATFMTCAIFRNDKHRAFDTGNIQENDWNTYPCVFPNGFMLYENFKNSENVFYLSDPCIYIVPHEKEWDDKILKIQEKIIPEFYDYILKDSRIKSLPNTEKIIFKQLFFLFMKKEGNTFMILKKILRMHFITNVIAILGRKYFHRFQGK